jgi:hypothetical protein
MKKLIIASVASLWIATISNAAVVQLEFDYSGINTSTNTQLTSSAVIRFGYFLPGTNFNQGIAALASEFFQVASAQYSVGGDFNSVNYENATSYTNGALVSRPYDSTPLDNSNSTADIASSPIYAWVLNNNDNLLVTEHGIFSSASYNWTDAQQIGGTNSTFSFDNNAPNFVAHIGTASSNFGSQPHQLAAIPEPSRALLGLIGLTGVMFRRRRAAKA